MKNLAASADIGATGWGSRSSAASLACSESRIDWGETLPNAAECALSGLHLCRWWPRPVLDVIGRLDITACSTIA